jgi:hypothetical protein
MRVWPEDIADRATGRSVWPESLRALSAFDVHACVHELLFATPSEEFLRRRRAQIEPTGNTLPYWQSRWVVYRDNLAKPVPVGIAAGLSAVLALGTASQGAPAEEVALATTERSEDAGSSRGSLRGDFVPTPIAFITPAPTTTQPPPPPTTVAPAPVATTAKPKPKPPATVPSTTSHCSTSKAAAHACWDGLIAQYPWNTTTAFNIMWCESRGNPNAKNPRSTATGLFQILNGPLDPAANVKLAYEMYSKRGWQPWVCKG